MGGMKGYPFSADKRWCSDRSEACAETRGAPVSAAPDNTENAKWVVTAYDPTDGNVTYSPPNGTLAPGASIQMTITISAAKCPGSNTFIFDVPGTPGNSS